MTAMYMYIAMLIYSLFLVFLDQVMDTVVTISDFSSTVQGILWEHWPLDKVKRIVNFFIVC
jgi:hypothetical protein